MNHQAYFLELISGFLAGKYDRAYVASKVANDIGVDEIKADSNSLLTNCEWALRHIDEGGYYTIDKELKYYLSCLRGDQVFSQKTRDEVMRR